MLNEDDQPLVQTQCQQKQDFSVILWFLFVQNGTKRKKTQVLSIKYVQNANFIYQMSRCPYGTGVILLFVLSPSTVIMLLQWLTLKAGKAIQNTEKQQQKNSKWSNEALIILTQRLQHYCF